MARRTVDIYNECKNDNHRLETYLTIIKGYLEGALSVCNNVEDNINKFHAWDECIAVYIAAALDIVYKMENRYGHK